MVQWLLYIVVFISGAVLMGLEIVGSRVLAPYFGSSIFVWGSLISVVMTALSIGYYWGGWLSAREPSYARLVTLLIIPGVIIFILPFLYPSINEWIAGLDLGNRLSPLAACSARSEEHTSELQSPTNLVCRLLLEKKKKPAPGARHAQRKNTRTDSPTHDTHT